MAKRLNPGDVVTARFPRLYPRLPAGTAGLPVDSLVLLDQTRALDVGRVAAYIGTLTPSAYRRISEGLLQMFGRPGRPGRRGR